MKRICSVCGENKDLETEFHANGTRNGVKYYHHACSLCVNDRNKISRKLQPEKYRITDRNERIKPKKRFSTAKIAARKRGLSWLLSFEEFEIIIKQPCYYCNFEFGEPVITGSGLDRIDNERGYEIDNVVSCCGFCNKLRNDFLSPEETLIAVKAIIDFRNDRRS